MTVGLPLPGQDTSIGISLTDLSGIKVYVVARLIVALARLAGPQHPHTGNDSVGNDSVETSNPASDEEETTQSQHSATQPTQLTLAFQRPLERPPLFIRRLSSKSTTSGASTPKQADPASSPNLAGSDQANNDMQQISQMLPSGFETSDNSLVISEVASLPQGLTPLSIPIPPDSPFRRPILRVKHSFASSGTSGNTSTADSRSRNSAWIPEFIPESGGEMLFAEKGSSSGPTEASSVGSPNRNVSFGLSDEYAQHQVRTFRSQTRYRVRVATKPRISQEHMSGNDSAIVDHEVLISNESHEPINLPMDQGSDMVSLPSTPKRRYTARPIANRVQATATPRQILPARASSIHSGTPVPMSPIAFPGTPPRTPRNHSGVLPQSLASSRRASYASSIGESTASRHSRQIIEVVVNGKRKETYVCDIAEFRIADFN